MLFLRSNPLTGWPYDHSEMAHLDPHLSDGSGFPNIFAHGALRADFCAHAISNWMGDDVFLRRLSVDIMERHIYGDALWVVGKVVKKYTDKGWDREFGAVDIQIEAMNQLGQNVCPDMATRIFAIPRQGSRITHIKLKMLTSSPFVPIFCLV